MNDRDHMHAGTILRATMGSTVHGLHHAGQDDRDEMAVFVEPPEFLLGLARARESGSTGQERAGSAAASTRGCAG